MSFKVLFVTPDMSDNSTGRTYALWLLAKHLGWTAEVLSFAGDAMWEPASRTEFAKSASIVGLKRTFTRRRHLRRIVRNFDLVVSVKPLRGSYHVAAPVCRRSGVPHVLDIDDPDLALRLRTRPVARAVLWRMRFLGFWLKVRNAEKLASRENIIVSNPELQAQYGGVVVPHARPDRGAGDAHTRAQPQIAFVGTARTHKGIDLLREAVAQVAADGTRLTVTDHAPGDAKPWEDWVGTCSLDEGIKIVSRCDIVIVPSLDSLHSRGQLPAKLMDAAMLGRGIIVTQVAPLPWAVGDGGLVVRPDPTSIARAIEALSDPDVRNGFGHRARALYLRRYSVEACATTFARACEEAVHVANTQEMRKPSRSGLR